MAVPQSDLGPAYDSFKFDWFFGGYEDNEERARDKSGDPEEERKDLANFRRIGGYMGMYIPSTEREGPPPSEGVERIFTLIHLFQDPEGAAGYLSDHIGERADRKDFEVTPLGDESHAYTFETAAEGETPRRVSTRVDFRLGRVIGIAAINRFDPADVREEVTAMAVKLDERVSNVLEGEVRGYAGDPATLLRLDQLIAIALTKEEFGTDYADFGLAFDVAGFLDNEEIAQFHSPEGEDERADYQRFGRAVGYASAYSSFFAKEETKVDGVVSSHVHLFGEAQGAAGYLSDAAEDERRLAGRTLGEVKVTSVEEFQVEVGEQSVGLLRSMSNGKRFLVLFRRGRLMGEIVVFTPAQQDRRSEAAGLAKKLDQRIQTQFGS